MGFTEQQVSSNHLMQKYLHGQLNADDKAAFEIFLLDHPDWIERLELDWAFQKMLPDAHQNVAVDLAIPVWRRLWTTSFKGTLAAIALGALLVCTVPHFYSTHPLSAESVASSQVVYLDTMRSLDRYTQVQFEPGSNALALVVDTGLVQTGHAYQLQLFDARLSRVVVEHSMTGNAQGEAVFMVPANLLSYSDYELRLNEPSGRVLHTYYFSLNQ